MQMMVLNKSKCNLSRMFLGVTQGIENTSLTAESVAESIDKVDDTATFTIRGPANR